MENKEMPEQEDSLVVQTWRKMEVSVPPAPSKAPQGSKSLCQKNTVKLLEWVHLGKDD